MGGPRVSVSVCVLVCVCVCFVRCVCFSHPQTAGGTEVL